MKTILIPITSNYIIRSFLRTDALGLLTRGDIRLVFLAPPDKIEYYRHEFPGENLLFDVLPPTAVSRSECVWRFIEVASVRTRTTAIIQRTMLYRAGTRQMGFLRILAFTGKSILRTFGGWRWWRRCLRGVYGWFPTDRAVTLLFEKHHPDLVYAATMLSPDMPFLKEAKKRRIPTAGMVLSWDNLYSKTILRVHPDLLLVHTPSIRRQAERLGDYPDERIKVIGIPQYDRVFRKEGLMPRPEFLASIGANPGKKLVVYALSGKQGLSIEYDIIKMLADMRSSGKVPALSNAEVLVRPYPRFDLPVEAMERIKKQYGFRVESSMAHAGTGNDSWEFDEASITLLINTLHHADLIITMYSTFFIEGAVAGKPLIGIAFDGEQKNDFWNSASRFFEWDHLAEIKPLGGIRLVRSPEELADAVAGYLAHPERDAEGRKRIVAQQCAFTDGKASERMAGILQNLVSKNS